MVLTSGSGESTGTILNSLASYNSSPFAACRPASAPQGLGTAKRGNLAIAFLSVLLLEELSPENPGKPGSPFLIADGAPISRWSDLFRAAVCRGLSRWTIRLTSDSPRSNTILDEDPRKKSRAKWNKASKKSCHLLPTTAIFCTLGALAQEAQTQTWPGVTIMQAAPTAVYQRSSACTKPDAAPFGQRGTGRNMVIVLMWHGSKGGYGSGWLNCTLLLNHAPFGKRSAEGRVTARAPEDDPAGARTAVGEGGTATARNKSGAFRSGSTLRSSPTLHQPTAALAGLTKVSLKPISRIAASAKSLSRQKLLQLTTVASSRKLIRSRGIRLPRLCV